MTDSEAGHEIAISRRARPAIAALGVGLVVLSVVAAVNARRAHGRPFASLFTDPYGSFSAISWPSWRSGSLPLRFPDHLLAIDGRPLPPPSTRFDLTTRRIAQRLAGLYAAGNQEARLTWATRNGPITITTRLRTLGAEEAVFFFVLYGLMGVFALWSGMVVLSLAGRRAAALAYCGWTVGTFIFLVTFYDYHTTAELAPLFSFATVWEQICVVWLAYSFPEAPRRHRRALRGAATAFTVLAASAGVILIAEPFLGLDGTLLRSIVAHTALLSLVALLVAVLLKLRAGATRRRRELLSAAWGLAVVPALLAVGFALLSLTGAGTVHLLLPFLTPLLPLSIGYAMISHNILGTRAVLTRRMFVVPVLTGALLGGLVAWLILYAWLSGRGGARAIAGAVSAGTALALAAAGYRLSGKAFFAATAKFRPTLQQLADDLASKRDVAGICQSIQDSVMKWLPTESALVVMPTALHRIPNRPKGYRAQLTAGRVVWTAEAHWHRRLLLPMRSQDGLRGVLVLSPKHQSALYTREDLELLETIASLGAVALHNADVIAELESLRRFEVDAARDDKRLALGLLGAEVSHEIAYPLNFLRYLLGQSDAGRPIDAHDLEIGREEIGRLERMFATLRKLTIPVPRPEPVLVLPRVRRALDLIRETLQMNGIAVRVDVPPDLTIDAEADPLVQIFANLLRNAAQAVPPSAPIGVRSRVAPDGAVQLEVWDAGPGVADGLAAAIFNPFVTSKEGSMGLGLAVTARLVRSFGWTIAAEREGGQTVFRIDIPARRPSPRHDEGVT